MTQLNSHGFFQFCTRDLIVANFIQKVNLGEDPTILGRIPIQKCRQPGCVLIRYDSRTILGGCDIDFLTGKGVVSEGLDESQPLDEIFKPVKLADWSTENRPEACDFF